MYDLTAHRNGEPRRPSTLRYLLKLCLQILQTITKICQELYNKLRRFTNCFWLGVILMLGQAILSDGDILARIHSGSLVVKPFTSSKVSKGVISYGLSHCGIDLRLGRKFKIFKIGAMRELINRGVTPIIDPKYIPPECFIDREADDCLIPPNSFVLAEVLEWIEMPNDLVGLIANKSSIARSGLNFPFNIAEPGWRGRLTLEIGNHMPFPARLYAGEGCVQMLFCQLSSPCQSAYTGKYQDQAGVTLPLIEK